MAADFLFVLSGDLVPQWTRRVFHYYTTDLHCRVITAGCYETDSDNHLLLQNQKLIGGSRKPAVKVYITVDWWLEPTLICHCRFVALADNDVVLSLAIDLSWQ